MKRRDSLKLISALGATTIAQSLFSSTALAGYGDYHTKQKTDQNRRAVYLIPGYRQPEVYYQGRPARLHKDFAHNIPGDYESNLTFVSRLDEKTGTLTRTLLPVRGHDIAVSTDKKRAAFVSQDGPTLVSFDPDSLEMDVFHKYPKGVRGGGHGVYLNDDQALAVCERKIYRSYSGTPSDHYGWITIRDSKSLKTLEQYDCQAVAPHEINILEDGKYAAIASYGSTRWPRGKKGIHRYVVEPSVVIMELKSGKIIEKYVPENKRSEYRHLAAYDRNRVFVMQNAVTDFDKVHQHMTDREGLYETDFIGDGIGEIPQSIVQPLFSKFNEAKDLIAPNMTEMIRGQSIVYDPVHDEVLATYTTSNRVVVFDGKNGSFKRAIQTDLHGLHLPRGITLHPDGLHYVVSGERNGLYLFSRGQHELNRERCFYHSFFGHAHITTV